jgi:MFS family permease
VHTSLWRQPGIRPLLVMTFTGFTGYAVLLPVVPLWAVSGGANSGEAGLVNGVMLLLTVLTQLFVPMLLRRWGWATVMATGLGLLGLPAVLHAVTDALVPTLLLSAVRGMGFGVLTVVGASAVAALVDPVRRGEAIGAYGLAVALPNVLLLPLGPWVAENVSYLLVFLVAAVPLLGIPASTRMASALDIHAPDLLHGGVDEGSTGSLRDYRPLLAPMVLLLSVTLAGGAVITFAPQMVSSGWLTAAGLFLMGLVAALSRWRVGHLADRYGAARFLWPLVLLTIAGTGLAAWSVAPQDTRAVAFLVAMLLLGTAYGGLQNLTLVVSFAAVSRRLHNAASAVWNIGFDLGTASGSIAVGAIATGTSFSTAMVVAALVSVVVLPLALLRSRPGS